MSLIIPTANMNGNTKASMVEQLQEAHDALRAAIEKLKACEYSNGRNFQTMPNGGALSQQARAQHGEWIQSVEKVKHAVIEVAYEISQQ